MYQNPTAAIVFTGKDWLFPPKIRNGRGFHRHHSYSASPWKYWPVQYGKKRTSSVSREMRIKATVRGMHFTLTKMAGIKRMDTYRSWQGRGGIHPSRTTGGNRKRCSHFRKLPVHQVAKQSPHDLASPYLSLRPRELKTCSRKTCILMFVATLFPMAKQWKFSS